METFNRKEITKILKADARALAIPSGAAEIFIEKTLDAVEKSFKSKKIITEKDLDRLILRELKKYHKDLAYVYENRDKII